MSDLNKMTMQDLLDMYAMQREEYMSDLNEMTMRDLLAMYAMQSAFDRFGFDEFDYQELAKVSYAVADAMMQERSTNQRSDYE